MMIPKNKNVCQLLWHLYVDTAIQGSKTYCYNTEVYTHSVVSLASLRMDVTRLGQRAYRKISILRVKNARDYHSDVMEAIENIALPFRIPRSTSLLKKPRCFS